MGNDRLPLAAMHRIIGKAGAERVSESATKELARVLSEVGLEVAREAYAYAMHAGRKTLKVRDVRAAAIRKLFEKRS